MDENTKRLSVLTGATLEPELDEKLQAIVSKAANMCGFSISLVSLVLNRIQYFRAHHGLPEELELIGATDRCSAFCTLVVQEKKPILIFNAEEDENIPQELVRDYGIKSYYGFPLELDGQVLGSLCVIDTVPKRLPPGAEIGMKELALEASNRLKVLQQLESVQPPLSSNDRQLIAQAKALQHQAKVSASELSPISRISSLVPKDCYGDPKLVKVMSVLRFASKAQQDLNKTLEELNSVLKALEDGAQKS